MTITLSQTLPNISGTISHCLHLNVNALPPTPLAANKKYIFNIHREIRTLLESCRV